MGAARINPPELPQSLYVQYRPDAASRQLLMALQSTMMTLAPSARPVVPDQLHVTVLHFGYLQTTYDQLADVRPGLERGRYDQAVRAFIEQVSDSVPRSCRLTIGAADRFGPTGSVAVLTLQPDQAYATAYRQSIKYLQRFAADIDIAKIADVPPRLRALQVPSGMTPHISLLKGVRHVAAGAFDAAVAPYIGEPLHYILDDLYI